MAADDRLDRVADAMRAGRTVALTGAGVSAASGVPTFRGADGVWESEFDPDEFRYGRLLDDPGGFWADRIALHDRLFGSDPDPNPAHRALAALEQRGHLAATITQNTDGLHHEAGSERLLELHGSARRIRCMDCDRRGPAAPVHERAREGERPPRCECGGVLRPDVVLFGESLPRDQLAHARELARDCDCMLAVGSSLTVEPAASLPRLAADGLLVVVNLDETGCDDVADLRFEADATELLPALAARLDG